MSYTKPTVADFKSRFNRDFPFGPSDDFTKVQDADIQRGIDEASIQVNDTFCADQNGYNIIFLEMAAHMMVMNLRASSQGVAGRFPWLDSSKNAGGVGGSSAIPSYIAESAVLSHLASTRYGAKYISLTLPYMYGRVGSILGATLPS